MTRWQDSEVPCAPMADPRELPDQARDFYDLGRRYVDEEIIQPAKRLGVYAGLGIGAGLLFSLGALLLGMGVLSLGLLLLPDTDTWDALAHVGAALVTGAAAAILFGRASS